MSHQQYIGRFAPSPSGPLHLGSLVAAVASFLDARKNQGRWLVRIEDIDPPREQPGAKDLILKALDAHGLFWDDTPVFQSQRLNAYSETLNALLAKDLVYYCVCTRKTIISRGKCCNGECYTSLTPPAVPYALRLRCQPHIIEFTDTVYKRQQYDMRDQGNCILLRKDGLFAYQLAVIVDDIWQQITHIVRGADLLDSTSWQLCLLKILNQPTPTYTHIPLVVDDQGKKLSKQHSSPAIPLDNPAPSLFKALQFLQLEPPNSLLKASVNELIEWGIHYWKPPEPS